MKLLFNTPKVDKKTKEDIVSLFEITDDINEYKFKTHVCNFSKKINVIQDESITLGFIYNAEKQTFEMSVESNLDIENRKVEIFEKITKEFNIAKYFYYDTFPLYGFSDCEILLEYLKYIAYSNPLFHKELTYIENLILEHWLIISVDKDIEDIKNEIINDIIRKFEKCATNYSYDIDGEDLKYILYFLMKRSEKNEHIKSNTND